MILSSLLKYPNRDLQFIAANKRVNSDFHRTTFIFYVCKKMQNLETDVHMMKTCFSVGVSALTEFFKAKQKEAKSIYFPLQNKKQGFPSRMQGEKELKSLKRCQKCWACPQSCTDWSNECMLGGGGSFTSYGKGWQHIMKTRCFPQQLRKSLQIIIIVV